MLVKHLLIILSAVALAVAEQSQQCGAPGGCTCNCDCNAGPPEPTGPPTVNCTGCVGIGCEKLILDASVRYTTLGGLLGHLLNTILSNLVIPILQIILAGNNSLIGAVLPLATILCYIVGLLLLVLQKLGLLGLLGPNGLLSNILGALTGGLGGLPGGGRGYLDQ